MALSQDSLNNGARWEVIWVNKRHGLTRKPFDHDFGAALRTYYLLRSSGRKGVTLRCCNVGFPPPVSITRSPVTKWEIVTKRGKRYKKRIVKHEDLLETKYNPVGIWWCPYCIQLRRFKQIQDEWTRGQHMVCPVCGITERNWHVRQYNPQAKIVEWRRRGRRKRTRSRTRVRRRTK
jgi:hypothetical protein